MCVWADFFLFTDCSGGLAANVMRCQLFLVHLVVLLSVHQPLPAAAAGAPLSQKLTTRWCSDVSLADFLETSEACEMAESLGSAADCWASLDAVLQLCLEEPAGLFGVSGRRPSTVSGRACRAVWRPRTPWFNCVWKSLPGCLASPHAVIQLCLEEPAGLFGVPGRRPSTVSGRGRSCRSPPGNVRLYRQTWSSQEKSQQVSGEAGRRSAKQLPRQTRRRRASTRNQRVLRKAAGGGGKRWEAKPQ